MHASIPPTLQRSKAPIARRQGLLAALSAAGLGFYLLSACGNSGGAGGDDSGSNGGSSSGVNSSSGSNGGNSSGSNSGGNNSSSGSNGGSTSSSGNSGGGSTSSSGNSGGGSSSGNSGGSTSSSGASGSGSSSGSSSGVIRDAGGVDSTVPGDGGACTNTDPTQINIDPSGFVCNNQWNIQGAWYCFADPAGTSDCTGTGDVPFKASASGSTNPGMCISGTTSAGVPDATHFGAAVGFVLNGEKNDAAKGVFNANTNAKGTLLGFAITISGDSGGSVLAVDYTTVASNNKEAPSVLVPGVATGSSPLTYNAMIKDAFITDNQGTSSVALKVDPTMLTSVEVKVPADAISHTYNFCVTKVVPIFAAPAAPAAFGNFGPTFKNQTQVVVEGFGPYGIQNDAVNPQTATMSMQAMYGGGQIGFSATPSFSQSTVTAFPAVTWGWVNGGSFVGGLNTGGYNGGKALSSLGAGAITSTWSYTAANTSMWDAAYDIWIAAAQDPLQAAAGGNGLELMIWLGHGGNTMPINGPGTASTVGGVAYNVADGTVTDSNSQPGSHRVLSYVRQTQTTSATTDIGGVFADAITNHNVNGSWFLLGIQAGFELYQPGTWTTTAYSVTTK
jgi:hypothetical protein